MERVIERELEKQIEALCLAYVRQVPLRHLLVTGVFFVSLHELCGRDLHMYNEIYVSFLRNGEFVKSVAESQLELLAKQPANQYRETLFSGMVDALSALKSVDSVTGLLAQFHTKMIEWLQPEETMAKDVCTLFLENYFKMTQKLSADERFTATPETVDYVLALAADDLARARVICDPFVGAGSIYLKYHEKIGRNAMFIANEPDELWRAVACMRYFLHGFQSTPVSSHKITSRDVFQFFPESEHDQIDLFITVFPDEYEDGKTVGSDEFVTFAEHMNWLMQCMSLQGKAYVFVPTKYLTPRGTYRKSESLAIIWKKWIESGIIESVISMPKIDFFGQNYSLLILNKSLYSNSADELNVHLIDFSNLTRRDFFTKPSLRLTVGHSNEQIVQFISNYSLALLSCQSNDALYRNLDFRPKNRILSIMDIVQQDESLQPADYFHSDISEIEMPSGQRYEVQVTNFDGENQAEPDDTDFVPLFKLADVDRGYNMNQASEKEYFEGLETSIIDDKVIVRNNDRRTIANYMKHQADDRSVGTYRIVHLANVQGGNILYTNLEQITIDFAQQSRYSRSRFEERYVLEDGDLLLSGRGYVIKIATVNLNDHHLPEKIIFSNNFMRIRPKNRDDLVSHYLNFYLTSPLGLFHLRKMQGKGSQPLISHKEVHMMSVPVLPLDKAKEIVSEAQKIEEERKRFEQNLNGRMLTLYEQVSKHAILRLIED